MCQVLY